MSQTIDRETLDRLIARGRAQGELTADDLRAALPVERMEVDALVLVMLELEAAGVSVEPEAFGPPADRPAAAAIALPNRDPGAPPAWQAKGVDTAASAGAEHAPVPATPRERGPDDHAGVSRAVLLAALATLLILGAVLLML